MVLRFTVAALLLSCFSTSWVLPLCHTDQCCGYAENLKAKMCDNNQFQSLKSHEKDYFRILRSVDELLETFTDYYRVDVAKRTIVSKKRVTKNERARIVKEARQLDKLIACLSKCSPGSFDYLDVKNSYLPLAREMRHRLHTYVMQPLNINALDMYDHAIRIGGPIVTISVAVGVILLLEKLGLLPRALTLDHNKLYTLAGILVAGGILYNYKDQIQKYGQEIEILSQMDEHAQNGTDLGALIHLANLQETSEQPCDDAQADQDLQGLAADVAVVAESQV